MAKKKSIETIETVNIIDSAPCENENKYRDTIDALEDIYIDVVGVSNEYTTSGIFNHEIRALFPFLTSKTILI